VSQRYFSPISSWLEAERNARIQLALSLGVQINRLNKSHEGIISHITQHRLDQQLTRVEVVSRALMNEIYYVLLRIKIR